VLCRHGTAKRRVGAVTNDIITCCVYTVRSRWLYVVASRSVRPPRITSCWSLGTLVECNIITYLYFGAKTRLCDYIVLRCPRITVQILRLYNRLVFTSWFDCTSRIRRVYPKRRLAVSRVQFYCRMVAGENPRTNWRPPSDRCCRWHRGEFT